MAFIILNFMHLIHTLDIRAKIYGSNTFQDYFDDVKDSSQE